MYKLYGVPLSQPFRSVAWTMLQLGVKFEIQLAVPGATTKLGTKHEKFRSLTPYRHDQVPVLVVDDKVTIAQSPAILSYICDRHGTNKTSANVKDSVQLYAPPGTTDRALIDSYLHWHHNNTRKLSTLFGSRVRPDLKRMVGDAELDIVQEVLTTLDKGWLSYSSSSSNFIAGSLHPTIADILAFEEISALTMTELVTIDPKLHPNLSNWMQQLSSLPYFDAAHQSLLILGNLSVESEMPLVQRLSQATKAGLQAFKSAQTDFPETLKKKSSL